MSAISMVVDPFSDAIIENPKLQENPALGERDESGQLAGRKFVRKLWACEVAGGPLRYTGKELGEAQRHIHITSGEFDEVGTEIDRSTTSTCRSPSSRVDQFLAAIVARKDEVVNPSP